VSPLDRAAIEAEAAVLLKALRECVAVAPPRERLNGLTIEDAYAIQRELIALRCAAGARAVGRKVGLTSAAMQEMLGVDQPDYGVLLDDMVLASGDEIDGGGLIAPRIEAEIAFVLGGDLAGPDVTVDDVLATTVAVRPALEVIDSRVADWRIAIEDTIADNASSALVVLGDEHDPHDIDLLAEVAVVEIGEASEQGRGEAVLGHPAAPVAWLAGILASRGEKLLAGDIVIPGAMARALPIASGDTVVARYATLGTIEVSIR
jgi:2-keto-4-pentenoate hydratase